MYASERELRRSSPIRERKLLFSNFNTENDRSAVAVDTGNVAKIMRSMRMLGKQVELQTSRDDSVSQGLSFMARHKYSSVVATCQRQ